MSAAWDRRDGAASAALGLVAAATTWVSTLAWRDFTEQPQRFLVPLAVLAVLVAGSGVLLRWWRTPGPLVVGVQVVLGVLAGSAFLTGSLLPVGEGWTQLRQVFVDASASAAAFAPPVPAEAPGVHPFLVAGGLGCLLLVDLLACTLRRAPLAGLPLLAVYSVPVGMLAISLTWWVFALTALGYLLVLALDQAARRHRWGRSLEGGSGAPATARVQAALVGTGVTALAVVVPLAIPTLEVELLGIGRGTGSEDIQVVNPTVGLRRDLARDRDVPLVRVRTDDPDPSYLRIAALTRFSRDEWSSGDRDIPTDQTADGPLPPLQGVSPTVTRTPHDYELEATRAFDSTWLPTPSATTEIDALGDWRYDTATADFIASDDDLTTAGLDWSLTAVDLDLEASDLATAAPAVGIGSAFTDLPTGIDPYVRDLAEEVTSQAPSPYEKAVALQNWFRQSGGFTYSLDVDLATSSDDLVRFLTPGEGGRTGYCEQFAASMAVMARQLGIPARVAVGFLQPDQTAPGTFEFSSHDLHAWPELYFTGGGWVRFEPTPPDRAAQVPGYTTDSVVPDDPTDVTAPEGANPDEELPRGTESQAPAAPEDEAQTAAGDEATSTDLRPWLAGALGLLLVLAAAAAPGLVRRRRRERRRHGDVEQAWAELRDTAVDHGLPWPAHRSPRETADALAAGLVGPDGAPLDPAVLQPALAGLERLVARLERHRYAPGRPEAAGDAGHEDVDAVLAAARATRTRAAQRRSDLLPASVLRRRPPEPLPEDARPLERV